MDFLLENCGWCCSCRNRFNYIFDKRLWIKKFSIGSLYVSQYFNAEDKKSAELLVTNILTEYIETIKSSTWMDDSTKQQALNITSLMTQYIGYHEKLVEPETETFYDQLPSLDQLNFFESGLAFVIFNADREYRRSYFEHEFDESDWTK